MEATAKTRFVRITPRKMTTMIDLIRGMNVNEAILKLQLSARREAARVVSKTIKSAVANADQRGTVDVSRLFIKKIMVGPGPILKRYMPRAKGSASSIFKRTSHLSVTVSEK